MGGFIFDTDITKILKNDKEEMDKLDKLNKKLSEFCKRKKNIARCLKN